MAKNLVNDYENGEIDSIYDEVVNDTESLKRTAKNKILGRQDFKRSKQSYISANKKAAKKSSVDTESDAAELNSEICGKKRY